MRRSLFVLFLAGLMVLPRNVRAETPANLVAEGVPEVTAEWREKASRYLEFRTAAFQGWHPMRREMLITTRFGTTPQLHAVKMPGGARRQLTFLGEPVRAAGYRPRSGDAILFGQDTGGGEFFQLYRYQVADGRIERLTDGASRNTAPAWSHDGRWLAFSSTRRNGRDNDIWVMEFDRPDSAKLLVQVEGGGWTATDWSPDSQWLVLREYLSANASHLWLVDTATGARERLTSADGPPVARGSAVFSHDGAALFYTSDEDGEFQRLGRLALADRKFTPLTTDIPWDIESFDLSPDGNVLAVLANEAGRSVLRFVAATPDATVPPAPTLPSGVVSGLAWHPDGHALGFSLTSARSLADAWSLNPATGALTRWTESECGGLDPATFSEPETWTLRSFDGLEVSGFVYRPDPAKFPGPRPVLVSIHGGPEGQSRPVFQGRNNFLLNELGIALVVPNVRGSAGFGKTFLTLDNGLKRKDSVKDIGAFLDRIAADPALDASRVAVAGGSYGGYMTLASLIDFGDRLRGGIDRVGISNFLTFLKNTQDYRRDLRRAEYGDERVPEIRDFLHEISPLTQATAIRRPLFVVQGLNDPRVPETESRQMVEAVRGAGGTMWYLLAKDEGHGFAKKPNIDFQFLAEIRFLREFLLD